MARSRSNTKDRKLSRQRRCTLQPCRCASSHAPRRAATVKLTGWNDVSQDSEKATQTVSLSKIPTTLEPTALPSKKESMLATCAPFKIGSLLSRVPSAECICKPKWACGGSLGPCVERDVRWEKLLFVCILGFRRCTCRTALGRTMQAFTVKPTRYHSLQPTLIVYVLLGMIRTI